MLCGRQSLIFAIEGCQALTGVNANPPLCIDNLKDIWLVALALASLGSLAGYLFPTFVAVGSGNGVLSAMTCSSAQVCFNTVLTSEEALHQEHN